MENPDSVVGRRNTRKLWRSGALAAAALIVLAGCAKEQRWNVLLVSFDTTRADHMACYGHPRAMTPNVDRLAAAGTRFDRAYASVPITLPSHSTIMTGTYPMFHGVRDNGIFVLADGNETLAEMLKRHGYATAAAVGSFPLTARFGIDQGFDFFDDRVAQRETDFLGGPILPKSRLYFDERPAGLVNEAVLPWLREHAEDPFFVWAHYFDPHQPWEAPPPYDQTFLADPYLGEIAYADESFGVLLDELERLGVADRTVVVLVSDHGEGLGEHNEMTHSMLTYNATLRVPLVIRVPGGSQREVSTRVGTVDIVPTVLDLLGIEGDFHLQGTSRADDVLGVADTDPGLLYAESLSPRLAHGWGELRAIYRGDLKYIHGPRSELFDVTDDPNEYRNLIGEQPGIAAELREGLAAFIAENLSDDLASSLEIDESTRQQLAALGYLRTTGEGEIEITEELRSDGNPPQDRVGDINGLSMAKQYLFSGRPLVARDVTLGLLENDRGNPAYLEMLAMAELQLGRYDRAMEALREIETFVQGGELGRRLLIQLAAVLLYQDDLDSCLEMVNRSNELEPAAHAYFVKAMAFSKLGREDDELAALNAALEVDPDHVASRINMAILQARRGDHEAAGQNFQRAVAADRYHSRAAFNLGAYLIERGDLEGAAELFERAVKLKPDYFQAIFSLAVVSADLGRWERVRSLSGFLDERFPETEEAKLVRSYLEEVS